MDRILYAARIIHESRGATHKMEGHMRSGLASTVSTDFDSSGVPRELAELALAICLSR